MTKVAKKKPKAIREDGWINELTGIGTSRDKRLGSIMLPATTLATREQYENIYHGDDMAATIAELPAREMVREWIDVEIESSGDSEESKEQSSGIMNELDWLDAQDVFFESKTFAHVYGGALVFIGADDGIGSDPKSLALPLNESGLKKIHFLKVFDRFEVEVLKRYDNPANAKFGEPELYRMNAQSFGSYGYSAKAQGAASNAVVGQVIHESRFIRIDSGVVTSRYRKMQNSGWCDSVYVRLEELLRDYGIAWSGTAHLLQDFAQAVFKIKGLDEKLCADGGGLVKQRLQIIDLCRSIARMIPIDAEMEDFSRTATPMSGLPETLDRFAIRLAAAARMPVTLLMGQSPAGLNATGASDLRIWYDNIAARQQSELRKPISRLIELIFKSKEGPTNGIEPENWRVVFNPLWQESAKEQADTRLVVAQTDNLYWQMGVLTEDEIAASRFGGDSYSSETKINTEQREQEAETDAAGTTVTEEEADDITQLNEQVEDSLRQRRADKVEKRGKNWVVLSMNGEVLGEHTTKKGATEQLQAIEASKYAKKK